MIFDHSLITRTPLHREEKMDHISLFVVGKYYAPNFIGKNQLPLLNEAKKFLVCIAPPETFFVFIGHVECGKLVQCDTFRRLDFQGLLRQPRTFLPNFKIKCFYILIPFCSSALLSPFIFLTIMTRPPQLIQSN